MMSVTPLTVEETRRRRCALKAATGLRDHCAEPAIDGTPAPLFELLIGQLRSHLCGVHLALLNRMIGREL